MTYTAIVKIENNRIAKFAEYAELLEAESHCAKHGGFVYEGKFTPDLFVEGQTVTVKPEVEKPEQAAKRLELALDAHIDSVAQSYRYDSIRTMVTYATSDNSQFGAEGRAAVKWRDACYVKAIEIQDAVQAGQRDIPTQAELIAEMPSFESFL
jgi:hypothetical protein